MQKCDLQGAESATEGTIPPMAMLSEHACNRITAYHEFGRIPLTKYSAGRPAKQVILIQTYIQVMKEFK